MVVLMVVKKVFPLVATMEQMLGLKMESKMVSKLAALKDNMLVLGRDLKLVGKSVDFEVAVTAAV